MKTTAENEIEYIVSLQEKLPYLKVVDFFEKSQKILFLHPNTVLSCDLNYNGDIWIDLYEKEEFYKFSLDRKNVNTTIKVSSLINPYFFKFKISAIDTKTVTQTIPFLKISINPEMDLYQFLNTYLDPKYKSHYLKDYISEAIPEKIIDTYKKVKL